MSKLEGWGFNYGGRGPIRSPFGLSEEESSMAYQFVHTDLEISDPQDHFDGMATERQLDADFINKFDDDFDDSDMIYDPIQRR
jgi:hypothetical protein